MSEIPEKRKQFRNNLETFFISLAWICLSSSVAHASATRASGIQIGDTYGRITHTKKSYKNLSSTEQKALRSTVALNFIDGIATGVFLGSIGSSGYVLTAHHVAADGPISGFFPVQGVNFQIDKTVLISPIIDSAIIRINFEDGSDLTKISGDRAIIGHQMKKDTRLISAGYGGATMSGSPFGFYNDEDCRVFYESLYDARFKTSEWQNTLTGLGFIGCEASHGDSGGPVFDRTTGELLGIVVTAGAEDAEWRYDSLEISKRFDGIYRNEILEISGILTGVATVDVLRQVIAQPSVPIFIKSLFDQAL